MPIPYVVARLNRRVTNRLLGVLAPWVPPFAVLHHRGRRTGAPRSTPLLVFRRGDRVVVALTYGERVDWLRNVLAAGSARLVRAGQVWHLDEPERRYGAEASRLLPVLVRIALRAIRVDAVVVLRARRVGTPER